MGYVDERDDTREDDYESDDWLHGYSNFHGYPGFLDMRGGFRGNYARPTSSIFTSANLPPPHSAEFQPKENVSSLLLDRFIHF